MAIVSSVRNLVVSAPFVDPDEVTYSEAIAAKEFEIRNANAVPGAGSLVELRQNLADTEVTIPESENVGEQLDAMDSSTGWVAGTSTAVATDTSVKNEGTGSTRLTVTTLAASGTSTSRSATGKAKPFAYGNDTEVKIDVRCTSLTNVSAIRLRLTMTNGKWLSWTITPSVINTWETKTLTLGSPFQTAGTMPIAATDILDKWEIDVVATSGGSVTSTVYVDNLRIGSVLTWESSYDVRVRYRDAAATFGPWSAWTTYKVSQPPTVAQAVALDNTDAAPTVDWSFTSPGGKAQASYRVVVTKTSDGSVVYDSGIVASSATVMTVPGYLLATATQYQFVVTAYDTDGLSGTWTPAAITTSFTTPAALASATATPSPSDSSVTVGWSATALSASQFYSYVVYRRDPASLTYTKIAEIFNSATLTYVDREAPHNITAAYQVRQSNGYAESDPVDASTVLALDYWISHPTDPTLVFAIPHVERYSERYPVQKESYAPLDRSTPVVVSSGVMLPAIGTVSFRRFPSQVDPLPSLRRAQIAEPYVILKSPFGDVFRVSIDEIEGERAGGGVRTGSFDYTTVG